MEGEVEAVETLEVLRVYGRLLVVEVAAERLDEGGRGRGGNAAHGFDFERPAEEHALAGVGQLDERHARGALWHDVDEAFRRQPVHRLAHRKPRDAHARADGLLVQEFAGLQVELHDGIP